MNAGQWDLAAGARQGFPKLGVDKSRHDDGGVLIDVRA